MTRPRLPVRPVLLMSAVVAAILVGAPVAGQTAATVAGRAIDGGTGAGVGLASVVVTLADSGTAVSGTLANEEGRFLVLGLAPGRYSLRVSFPGFAPGEVEVLVSELNPTYDVGDVELTSLVTLQDLSVTADAIRTAGIDSQVFRMDEGATLATGTILDALKNLPGITVDQDGRVSLRGSDQVAILIDGRQSSLTGFGSQRGLDNVPASNVAAIEIIHNPSASFDAAGMAGIVNIIYKQERQLGLLGDLGLSMGLGQFTKQRADLPTELGSFSRNHKVIPSVSLAYNTEQIRTFLQAEFLLQDDLPNNEFTTRSYDDGRVIRSQVPENREQTHHVVRAGGDLLLGESDVVTISGIHDLETHTDRAQVPFILASTGERERFWFWREKESTGFANIDLTWKHRFATPGHELDVDLQYTRGWEDEAYFLNEVSSVREGTDMTHLDAVENTLPFSIDYTRPLASGRLEIGGKLQRRWLPITYTVDRGVQSVIYPGLGDYSDWDEDLFAAYANLVRITDRYTLEAGLRAEQTDVAYTIPDENIYYEGSDAYDYFELFPNAKLGLRIGDRHRLILAYNRRIDRPGEPELRVFPKYDDPELLKVGNPFLRPQLTNVLELGLSRSWEAGSVSTSAYRRAIDDAFLRVFAIDESNPDYDIVNKIFANAGNSTQTGLEVVLQHQVADAWQLSTSLNWFVNEIDPLETTLLFPTERPFALAGTRDGTWDLNISNRIELPRGAEALLGYIRYAERNVPQGIELARSSIDLSVSWPIRDQQGEVVFTLTDLFNDFAVRREIDGNGFDAVYENFRETQVATVGLRWRIG